jgi:stage V sporulation protein S
MAENEKLLKVKGSTSAPSLAATIAHGIYDGNDIVLRAIGAAAVNQAVKAVAIAQSYVGLKGKILHMRPGFTDIEMPDGTVTGMIFTVEAR